MSTLGQSRVRTKFNPSSDDRVQQLKDAVAACIDMVNAVEAKNNEEGRLKALCLTDLESAAMWGVKYFTA